MNMTMFGLTIIALGWVIQFASIEKKNQSLNLWFLVGNIVGTLLLILDSISTNAFMSALLYAATIFAATGVLLKLNK